MTRSQTVEFPLRVIFDDGDSDAIETPEELLEKVDSIDSSDPRQHVWVRDALDRTVLLTMRNGEVIRLEVAPDCREGTGQP